MTRSIPKLRQELLALPPHEQLEMARWLINHAVEAITAAEREPPEENPLLAWAGRFSGGPGDSAERAEEILEQEVDAVRGLSTS
jgi:hypothetical protein